MKGPTKNPHWLAAHACLKNEITEEEKSHNLMSWLLKLSRALLSFNLKLNCYMMFCCNCSWRVLTYQTSGVILFEPEHKKTNKMTCVPSKDLDQPGHLPSLIRVFIVHLKLGPWATLKALHKDSDQMCWCPRWSESSLGAQVTLLVLSYSSSFVN